MNPKLEIGDHRDLAQADVIFNALPFKAVEEALKPLQDALKGKIVVDCSNPVGPNLKHDLGNKQSGTEWIQQSLLPESYVVKAFTIYGYENFDEATRLKQKSKSPVMLYCGNNDRAKQIVAQLIELLGWVPVDVGDATSALHLEHMTLLWIKMVRVQRRENFVWAMVN